MARQVLPIVGLIVGAYFGQPALGYAIGSMIGNAVDPLVIKGPKLGEAGIQTAAEGVYRPIVYGTAPVKGNIINRGNRQIRTHREQQGKGGPITETERVYWTWAIRICEGPIGGVLRIWMDEKLVYDARPGSPIPAETGEFFSRIRLYLGDEDQLPDPDLEAYLGIGNVNAYRGTAYIVFPNFDLTDYAERIPDFRFEVASSDTGPGPVMAIIHGRYEEASQGITQSTDGTDWDGIIPLDNENERAFITSIGARFIRWDSANSRYSDDFGETWSDPVGNFGLIGGQHQFFGIGSILLIPGGIDNGVFRSLDQGTSYTHIPSIHPVYNASSNIALRDTYGISINGSFDNNCLITVDGGLTWQEGGTPEGLRSGTRYIACNSFVFMIGGKTASSEFSPCVNYSTNGGMSWSMSVLPTASETGVTYLCHAFPVGAGVHGRWVAGTDNGELFYSDDNGVTWEGSEDSLGEYCVGLDWNGVRYIAAGSNASLGTDGIIKTSLDGENWTEHSQPYTGINLLEALPFAVVPPQEGHPVALSSIVSDLHQRAGHAASQYNVTELTNMVDGLVLAGDYTCADAIRTLMPVYMYDASEHDAGAGYKVNYIKRGKAVVATLTLNDLVEAPEESTREDSLERPRVLHMHFENPLIGYAPAKASPKRNSPDIKVVGEVTISVPVVFGDVPEAWQVADKMLKVLWAEVAGEQKLSVPYDWLKLVPTDTIGLVLRNQVRRLRITQQDVINGVLPLKLMADRQSAYTSNLTGIPLPPPTPPIPSLVGQSILAFLDIPALNDTNDRPLYYLGVTGQTPAWYGADAQRSLDLGANYVTATSFTINTIMGTLMGDVTAASPHYTDTTNQIRVQLYMDDEVDSLTMQQFLSEGGAIAIESASSDGGWEVLQYRDAMQDSSGVYELEHLARGRLNTEATDHSVGAMVVFLEGVRSVDAVTAWLNENLTHRAVSFGTSPESAPPQTDVYTMQSQREWPVAHLFGELDGDDLDLSCVPRHRFGTEDHPVQSINHDGYRWTATDGSSVASADTSGPSHTFDVTGWSTPIIATVAQLNRFTGAGPIVSESIE